MKTVYLTVVLLFILLFAVHIVLTPRIYASLSVPAMWFAGTGLMGVFLGLLNIAYIRDGSPDGMKTVMVIASNVVALAFFLLGALLLGEVQAWIAVTLCTGQMAFSFLYRPGGGYRKEVEPT